MPIAFLDDKVMLVATADPANVLAIDDLSMMTGYEIQRAVATEEDVDALLGRLGRLDAAVEEIEEEDRRGALIELRESAEDAPVVKLVRSIVADAVERGASDIHFDPEGKQMRVRFRVDGVVSDTTTVPKSMIAGLVSRVKIMADLDIAEKRVPQDGRVGLNVDGRHVDIRVATLPDRARRVGRDARARQGQHELRPRQARHGRAGRGPPAPGDLPDPRLAARRPVPPARARRRPSTPRSPS